MTFKTILLCLPAVVAPLAVNADDRGYLGTSRVFNNDYLGDNEDRWRTGSYAMSVTVGTYDRAAPPVAFDLMEYRLRLEMITPEDLSAATAFPDRPYAGVIGLGAFTHMKAGTFNVSFGGELNFTGPKTGMGDLQEWFHQELDLQVPQMLGEQLGNAVYPTVQGEVSRDFRFGSTLVRPFVEAQAGLETYARGGLDIVVGRNFSRNFFTRDPITGHLMTNLRASDEASWGFVAGADAAVVVHSNLLPSSRGYEVERWRPRARAGIAVESEKLGLFYGLTYLGPEFEGQREGQVTGSLHLRFNF